MARTLKDVYRELSDMFIDFADEGNADMVLKMIANMNQSGQVEILRKPDVVQCLARNGHAGAIISLLTAMDKDKRAIVLEASGTVAALEEYGQKEALARIRENPSAPESPVTPSPRL